jgi:DNA polymerase V
MTTNQLVLTIGYDRESLTLPNISSHYQGEIVTDHYGRPVPKPTRGTANLNCHSSSSKEITNAVISLYDRIVNKELLIRRLNISTNHIKAETYTNPSTPKAIQLDLFADINNINQSQKAKEKDLEKERRMQEALLKIKHRFGNNAILKGTSFSEGATGRERHKQIGGHKA